MNTKARRICHLQQGVFTGSSSQERSWGGLSIEPFCVHGLGLSVIEVII
jgi:hypothetical protein